MRMLDGQSTFFAKRNSSQSTKRKSKQPAGRAIDPMQPTSGESSSSCHGNTSVSNSGRKPNDRYPDLQISGIGNRTWFHLLAIVITALAIRLAVFSQLKNELPFSTLIVDSRVYDQWAMTIVNGNWLGDEVYYQSPLYPYVLAAIYSIAGHQPMVVRYVQGLLGSIACGLVALAGIRLISKPAGLTAGWLLAFYAPALFFDGLIQKSSLDLFFMSLVMVGMAQFLTVQSWPWLLWSGISLGLLILNRENARLIYPVIAVWLLFYFSAYSWGRRLAWLAAMSIGCALILLPVGMRNYWVGGEFLLTTSQFGPNFYIGNHPGANGLYKPLVAGRGHTIYERTDAVALAERATGRKLTPSQVSAYWRNLAFQFIRTSPIEWSRLMLWKSYLVLHGQEMVDSEGIEVHCQHSWLLNILRFFNFGVLCSLAAVGICITWGNWRRLLVIYMMIVAMLASVVVFFVFSRYRFPVVPLLVIFAGAAVCAIPKLFNDPRIARSRITWAVSFVGLLILILLNWPLPQYRDDAIAYANYGRELLEEGQYEKAEIALRKSIAITPNAPGPVFNLGRLLELNNRVPEAIEQYERAVKIDPQYGRAHWMLGRHRLSAGDLDGAIQRLRNAANLIDDLDVVHFDYAMALSLSGRTAEAAEQYRRALAINPRSVPAANNLVWLLATSPDDSIRNADEALEWVKILEPLQQPEYLDTIAAAQAESGQFSQAVETAQLAIEMALHNGEKTLALQLESRLRLYRDGKPFREIPSN